MRTSFVVMAAIAAFMSGSNAIQLAGTEVSETKVLDLEKRIARIEGKLDIENDKKGGNTASADDKDRKK